MAGLRVALVALPIGNAEDLSFRAKKEIESATRIFCEDTRKFREFISRSGMESSQRLSALPGDREHEMDWKTEIAEAKNTDRWVLVSDAGTPVVNDPGKALVQVCFEQGIELIAIPGPCAPVVAWQWSGGFGLPFVFAGFAPKSAGDLPDFFARLPSMSSGATGGTFCFFDTRYQVLVTLDFMLNAGWGNQKLFIARDMTKKHEELIRGTVETCTAELQQRLKREDPIGELTLVLEAPPKMAESSTLAPSISDLAQIRALPPKAAAKLASKLTGLKASECYDYFVKEKDRPS